MAHSLFIAHVPLSIYRWFNKVHTYFYFLNQIYFVSFQLVADLLSQSYKRNIGLKQRIVQCAGQISQKTPWGLHRPLQRIAGAHTMKYFGGPWKFKNYKIFAKLFIKCALMKKIFLTFVNEILNNSCKV